MKISTKGRYALNIMVDLAKNSTDEKYISLTEISKRLEISNKYLEQIISALNKNNLVLSTRGNNGGYKLAKKPEEYIIGDILRATEGNLSPLDCLSNGSVNSCPKKHRCATLSFWQGLDKAIEDYVDSKTLADLI
jgi:Rrf2 family protein